MYKLHIEEMTCGNCAGQVLKALKDVDAGSKACVDLANRSVIVVSAFPVLEICESLADAGFSAISKY